MKLKVGNKYLCKKEYVNVLNDTLLTTGKIYEIVGENPSLNEFWVKSNSIELPMSNNKEEGITRWFWDFFYTEKELRKLKLDTIGRKERNREFIKA